MSDTKISEALAWCSTCPNSGRQEVTNNHNTLGAWHRAGRKITSLHPQPAELAEQQEVELPPLPPVDGYDKRVHGHYSAEQMRDYARNAIRSAKQEQACSGLGIDKMAKELLERHTVAVPVAVEDGRCFMVREQDALDAILAALAATGKQQVDPAWSLHDRVEFALRDAGFDFDEASRIALLADRQQVGEVQGIDLGQLRELAESWKVVSDPDPTPIMQAHQHANHCCADELLALIDGRDAAPGVGNG